MAQKKRTLAKIGEVSYQRIFDWSGGMNDAVQPVLLNDNESPLLQNASLDEKGTLYPRKGSKERYPSKIADSPVTGIGAYYKSDGTSRILIGAGSSIYTDKPHIVEKFDAQADWQRGSVAGFASLTKTAGSVVNDGTPTNRSQTTDTQAQWDAGTKTNVISKSNGTIELAVRRNPLSITENTFDDHVLISTSIEPYTGVIRLARQ
ncbi:hypothetical protein BSNK01_11880 [Bacillaceae bacterium]